MMLGANMKVQDSNRFTWKPDMIIKDVPVKMAPDDLPVITLQPMQIRTFVISVNNA